MMSRIDSESDDGHARRMPHPNSGMAEASVMLDLTEDA